MADLQQFIKNNGGEFNANVMQQFMNQEVGGNQNNTNSFGGDSLNVFNDSSDKDNNSDVSNTNKRLFLETQVQPVQRLSNNPSYGDDDLLKFFQTELGDDPGQGDDDFNGSNDVVSKKISTRNESMRSRGKDCLSNSSFLRFPLYT